MHVAAEACAILSARDIDGAAVDGQRTHTCGSDARLILVTIVDDQRTWAIDGQRVALAQFDALRGSERSPIAEIQNDIAADGDARRDGQVLIDCIHTFRQCGHVAGDGSAVCHRERDGLCARVVALGRDGQRVVALLLHGGGADGVVVVGALGERLAIESDGGRDGDGRTCVEILSFHAADDACHVVVVAIGSRKRLGDIVGGNGGVGQRALGVAQRLGVVATRAYSAAAHEGGAVGSNGYLVGSRRNAGAGGIERIGEAERFGIMPAYEAATLGGAIGGKHAAVVHAAREVYIALRESSKAAVGAVAADAAVDDGADLTVRDGHRAVGAGYESRSELLCGINIARHLQVRDGGTIRITEWGAVLLAEGRPGAALREGQRLAVAQERALERVGLARTRHLADADALGQPHVLAAEVVGASADRLGELVPSARRADDVGVVLRAGAAEGGGGRVELAVKRDAVLIDSHHAVVLHQTAEVGGSDVVDRDLSALVGRQIAYGDIVAAVDGRFVACVPAGEGVSQHACGHAAGLHQRVLDGGLVVDPPSDEAAAVFSAIGGGKGAVEHAAVDGDVVAASAQCADQSAVRAVTLDAAVDVDRTDAAREGQRAVRLAHDAGSLLRAGVDGTIDVQVLDRSILHVEERSAVFLGERTP